MIGGVQLPEGRRLFQFSPGDRGDCELQPGAGGQGQKPPAAQSDLGTAFPPLRLDPVFFLKLLALNPRPCCLNLVGWQAQPSGSSHFFSTFSWFSAGISGFLDPQT